MTKAPNSAIARPQACGLSDWLADVLRRVRVSGAVFLRAAAAHRREFFAGISMVTTCFSIRFSRHCRD